LFFLFKSKTNKKGEEISNLMNPFRTSLLLLSYKNPIQQRCCHFLQRKTKKNKPSTYKPKVPPKYWTFFAKHITRMTEITICL
jgi:hypothetical protein